MEELDFDLSSDSDVDSEEGDSEDDDYEDMNLDIEEDMAALKRLQDEEEDEEEESTTGYGGMERVLRLNAGAGGKGKKAKGKGSSTKVDFNELARLLEEAEQGLPDRLRPNPQVKTKVKVNKQSDVDVAEPPAKKRKTSKTKATPAPTFDLVEPEFVSSRPSSSKSNSTLTINDSYGDQTALTSTDIADKSARRHTLRFHTSKIESSAARRSGARAALGGDDDVPYRERRKEKDIKERKEREKRKAGGKLGMGGDDLDDEEPETKEKKSRARGADEENDGEGDTDMLDGEGYYELVSKARKDKKEKKKKEHDEEKFASRYVFYPVLKPCENLCLMVTFFLIDPTSTSSLLMNQVPDPSPALSSRTVASHHTVPNPCAIRVSRSARDTTRRRRSLRHNGRCTRAGSGTRASMRASNRVSPRLSRVCGLESDLFCWCVDGRCPCLCCNRLPAGLHSLCQGNLSCSVTIIPGVFGKKTAKIFSMSRMRF